MLSFLAGPRETATLLDAGMAAEEIAVVLRLDGSACDVVEDVFSSHAILRSRFERRRSLEETAVGRALVGLLNCSGPRGELDDLLSFLRAPGVLSRLELAERPRGARAAHRRRQRRGPRGPCGRGATGRSTRSTTCRAAAERGSSALIERARRDCCGCSGVRGAGLGGVLADDELDEAACAGGRANMVCPS